MRRKPRVRDRRTVASSRLFRIEEVELEFANGVVTHFERLGHTGGAVLIVPLLNEDTVLLAREYAVGTERYELGFPKGRIEPGEDPLTAANREIMEEIGYGASTLTTLAKVTLAPGYVDSETHIVLARELREQKLEGDEPEEVEVVPWPVTDLRSLLAQPDFTEARSIAALYMLMDALTEIGN